MGLVQELESVPGELLKLNLKKRERQVYVPAMGWVSVCLSAEAHPCLDLSPGGL